jgi:hypothetical protein
MADSAESPAAAATAAAPGPDGGEGAAKKPTAKELRMQKKAEEVRGGPFFRTCSMRNSTCAPA